MSPSGNDNFELPLVVRLLGEACFWVARSAFTDAITL